MELEIKKDLVSSWFKTLQDAICHSINDIENNKKQFISTNWKKNHSKDEGGGEFRILSDGKVFDKVGVNFSKVYGKFPKKFQKNIPGAKKYEKSYNYPLSRGKWDALEGGVRVPLIVAGPGIKKGSESAIPVSGVDLLPTLIELAGNNKKSLTEVDGGSFAPILLQKNDENVDRPVEGIFFHVPYRNGIALKRPHSAVRKGDYKLVKFQDDQSILLFNLEEDIMEQTNLALQYPDKAMELEKILDDYLVEVHAPKWQEGITWKTMPLKEINSNY